MAICLTLCTWQIGNASLNIFLLSSAKEQFRIILIYCHSSWIKNSNAEGCK